MTPGIQRHRRFDLYSVLCIPHHLCQSLPSHASRPIFQLHICCAVQYSGGTGPHLVIDITMSNGRPQQRGQIGLAFLFFCANWLWVLGFVLDVYIQQLQQYCCVTIPYLVPGSLSACTRLMYHIYIPRYIQQYTCM